MNSKPPLGVNPCSRELRARRIGSRKQGAESLKKAEREGFEPSNGFHRYTISSRAPSTTRTSLHIGFYYITVGAGSQEKQSCDSLRVRRKSLELLQGLLNAPAIFRDKRSAFETYVQSGEPKTAKFYWKTRLKGKLHDFGEEDKCDVFFGFCWKSIPVLDRGANASTVSQYFDDWIENVVT